MYVGDHSSVCFGTVDVCVGDVCRVGGGRGGQGLRVHDVSLLRNHLPGGRDLAPGLLPPCARRHTARQVRTLLALNILISTNNPNISNTSYKHLITLHYPHDSHNPDTPKEP